jgi:hypothetical protein
VLSYLVSRKQTRSTRASEAHAADPCARALTLHQFCAAASREMKSHIAQRAPKTASASPLVSITLGMLQKSAQLIENAGESNLIKLFIFNQLRNARAFFSRKSNIFIVLRIGYPGCIYLAFQIPSPAAKTSRPAPFTQIHPRGATAETHPRLRVANLHQTFRKAPRALRIQKRGPQCLTP